MSEYYNCTICRKYPCSCGTAVRTNLNIPDDSVCWKELSKWKGLCRELVERMKLINGDPHETCIRDIETCPNHSLIAKAEKELEGE